MCGKLKVKVDGFTRSRRRKLGSGANFRNKPLTQIKSVVEGRHFFHRHSLHPWQCIVKVSIKLDLFEKWPIFYPNCISQSNWAQGGKKKLFYLHMWVNKYHCNWQWIMAVRKNWSCWLKSSTPLSTLYCWLFNQGKRNMHH